MSQHVHILAICGYTTGGLALMARKLGYTVTGSDEDAYPPMSTRLTQARIPWENFHAGKNLARWGRPDLVIQGNQIRRGNPELQAARRLKIPVVSDSEFFYTLVGNRRRIVIAGTHGKTTTAALVAWILKTAGRDPGFRLGTLPKNFPSTVELGTGQDFVFEGDEYTTGFNDRRPKFFYFRPQVTVINNIEWDHPDVFKAPKAYRRIFKEYLIDRMPRGGRLVVNAEDPNINIVVKGANCRVSTFGLAAGDFRAENIEIGPKLTTFNVSFRGRVLGRFQTSLTGLYNVRNCLGAIATGYLEKVSLPDLQRAVKSFKGVSRRFEILGSPGGITVVDDYAHHPTKARETIAAARARFPKARVFVVYVPHTYSRTKALSTQYIHAFDGADFVVMPDIEPARERHLSALISSADLADLIRNSRVNTYYIPDQSKVIEFIVSRAKRGDVVLCMSVRGFDNLAAKLVGRLERLRLRD